MKSPKQKLNEVLLKMKEKVLIKSERYNILKGLKLFVIICFIATVIWSISDISNSISYYNDRLEYFTEEYVSEKYGSNAISYAISSFFEYSIELTIIPVLAGLIVSLLIYAWMHSYELTITDKRIYGKVAFGKRVDLPVDSVSATATITLLKGVSVSTSSGRISFLVIKNSSEIYEILNQLLIERQSQKKDENITRIEAKSDEADQLKKYKDLLDSGVITQEEFDQKKKQLLGL